MKVKANFDEAQRFALLKLPSAQKISTAIFEFFLLGNQLPQMKFQTFVSIPVIFSRVSAILFPTCFTITDIACLVQLTTGLPLTWKTWKSQGI